MGALGVGLTGLGQGYVQGNEIRNQRNVQQQQLGLQERQVKLGETGQAQDEAFRREQAARAELAGMDATENSEGFGSKLTPEQQARIRETHGARRSRIYHDFPHLSDSALGADDYQIKDTPTAPDQPTAPTPAQPAQPEPSAYANVQPTFLPDGTPQATLPGQPAQPEPTAPTPAPEATPAANPVAGPPAPPAAPKTITERLIDKWIAKSNDASLAQVDRDKADDKVMEIISQVAQNDQAAAGTLLARAQAAEVHPNAVDQRLTGHEGRAASMYDRNVYKPELLHQGQEQIDLNKLIAKGKAGGGGLTVADRIKLMELQNTINQQAIERKDKKGEQAYQHGKDAATFEQSNQQFEAKQGAPAQAAILKAINASVMTVDPITHVPTMKPGGVEAVKRMIADLQNKGQTVTADALNPGYPPTVWAKVNEPGMTEQSVRTAVQNALVAGDRATAVLIKNAWAATRMLGGSGPAPAAKAAPKTAPKRTAAKPAAQPKYSYGGGRGEERR